MSDDCRNDPPPGDTTVPSDRWASALETGLAALPCPALPGEVGERVARLAHAHLAPPPGLPGPALGFRLREALVPAMLMSAAVVRTADTLHVARQVFGDAAADSDTETGGGERR
jgi:hypothetical protein